MSINFDLSNMASSERWGGDEERAFPEVPSNIYDPVRQRPIGSLHESQHHLAAAAPEDDEMNQLPDHAQDALAASCGFLDAQPTCKLRRCDNGFWNSQGVYRLWEPRYAGG